MFCSCSRSWNCKGRRELPGKAGHIYEVVSSLSWRYFIKNKRGGRRESRKGWLISQLTRILSSMGQRLHLKPAMEYSLAFFWTLNAVCLVPLVALKFSWTVHSFRNSAWSEEQCLKRRPPTVYISLAPVQWTLPLSLSDVASGLAVLTSLYPLLYRLLVFF